MRTAATILGFIFALKLIPFSDAAPPPVKPADSVPTVDAGVLPAGQFTGMLASTPDSDRMFTVTVTYPEVRQKLGTRMPNLQTDQARNLLGQYQQLLNLQQQLGQRNANRVILSMMQLHQRCMQLQATTPRTMQATARLQQRELRLLQQEINTIQRMYQVVQVKRDIAFQAEENVKVRLQNLPEQFDEKGNVKKYTKAELLELKGKDKSLIGFEGSVESLKPGQTVDVTLRTHKSARSTTVPAPAAKKDKEQDQEAVKKEADASVEHKMQVTMIVITQDSDATQNSAGKAKKNKK